MPGILYSPELWGGPFWTVLHTVAYDYPTDHVTQEDRARARRFVRVFGENLPCGVCQHHFEQMLREHPLDDQVLSGRDSFVAWANKLHNEVNVRKGKPEVPVSECNRLWLEDGTPEWQRKTTGLTIAVSVLAVVVVAMAVALGFVANRRRGV